MSLEQLSLKLRFPFIIRVTGLLSIILLISLFFVLPRFTGEGVQEHYDQIIIEQIDIPQTQQIERPPPPARPSIPIESEDEDLADDLTIEETDLSDFEAWDAPPPPPSGPQVKFIPYDDPPVPLTPIRPKYPEIAQEAGIEGTVYIQFFIDVKGNVTEAWVQKGIPNTGLNEAALIAVKRSKWKPAQQRDKKVGVWQTVPVKFELTSH